MRGASFSNSGPGDSLSISTRPLSESRGRIASAATMMPMPPSHWVSARQKRIAREWLSMSAIALEPVVVNPDMASK